MDGFIGAIKLSRPGNLFITMFSVFVAAAITGTLHPLNAVLLACIAAVCVAAGGNTINDYYDVEIDRVNKPHRPLPAGQISPHIAKRLALAEFVSGLLLAALISVPMFCIALVFSILIYLYSAFLKRTVIWGNLVVSLTTAAAFIFGGTAVNRPREAIIPAIFAFLFHFGREIIKDIEDIAGDQQENARTLPVRYGVQPAIALVWIVFLALLLATLLPFLSGEYGRTYFAIVVAGIYPVIIYTLISILKNHTPAHLGRISTLLKADMLVGLLAIYFG